MAGGVAAALSLALLTSCTAGTATPAGITDIPALIAAPAAQPSLDALAALRDFSLNLFGKVLENNPTNDSPSNIAFSPLSAWLALGAAGAGARGDTAAAFESLFGVPQDEVNRDALYVMQNLDPKILAVANALFSDATRIKLNKDFQQTAGQYYGAGVWNVDFGAPKKTADLVNAWIADRTHQLIDDLVDPDTIDPAEVLMIVNTLYFKADWVTPFMPDLTQDAPFNRADGQQSTASYMTMPMGQQFVFNDPDGAVGVVLPYVSSSPGANSRYAFVAAMPNTDAAIHLDGLTISTWFAQATMQPVDLMLPKLEITTKTDLKDLLTSLGLGIAFTDKADFSGIGGPDPLKIGEVKQKAVVKVNEAGTEAAAATEVGILAGSAQITDPVVVHFDRPYIYAIVDTVTQVPLFLGYVRDAGA